DSWPLACPAGSARHLPASVRRPEKSPARCPAGSSTVGRFDFARPLASPPGPAIRSADPAESTRRTGLVAAGWPRVAGPVRAALSVPPHSTGVFSFAFLDSGPDAATRFWPALGAAPA